MSTSVNFNQTQGGTPPADLNPLDDQLRASAGGDVWASVSRSFATLNAVPTQLEAIADQLFAAIVQCEADTRLTTAAKAQDVTDLKQKAAGQIVALRQTADAARAQVLNVVEPILNGGANISSATPNAALFVEQRRDAWTGAKMVLDAIEGAGVVVTRLTEMAKDAAARRDAPLMSALRQWAGPYLESRGQVYPPDILARMLDEAMAPALSPRHRAAMVIKHELIRGWQSVETCFQQAQALATRRNWMRADGLPGWLPNSVVRI